jgi:signal transduction histidine kinase/CheY-like chemotaxis protein
MMSLVPVNMDDPLEELRANLTRRLAQLMVVAAGLGIYTLFFRHIFDVEPYILFLLLGVCSFVVQLRVKKHPVLARRGFLWGLQGGLMVGMLVTPALWLPFLGVFITFVGSMLVTRSALVTTASISAVAGWLTFSGVRDYPMPELGVALGLSLLLAWCSVNILFTAVVWYSTMQEQADRLLQETRDNRADLKQTLRSLEISYDSQSKMRRELVQAREQAEAARRLKERFAANISHELRTPLNLILGFSEVMHLSPEVYGDIHWTPTLRRDIYQIYRSSRHLMGMVDDILDLSHFEMSGFTINLERTDLVEFLDETVSIVHDLFRNHAVQFEVVIMPDLPFIDIDRTRIRQVLLNLITNAKRFTLDGWVRLEVRQVDREIVIDVRDTGPGIPEDKLANIFDEFYQVDYSLSRTHGGAGLGLAISKKFVEAHNGKIEVESTQGVGSTFTVRLPIPGYYPTREGIRSPLGASNTGREARPALVVIDSDPTVTAMIRRHLESFEVHTASNEQEFTQAVAEQRPHAIIRNVIPGLVPHPIPGEMKHLPLIECTLPGPSLMVHELAVDACLAKPIGGARLIAEIQKLGEGDVQNILVIDDDRGFVQLVQRIVQNHDPGITVHRAYDGGEGLDIMQRKPLDMVLLDLAMPDMDGFAVLDAMRADAALALLPVILLTAANYADDSQGERESLLSIRWPDGLFPREVLRCMRASLEALEMPQDTSESVRAAPPFVSL